MQIIMAFSVGGPNIRSRNGIEDAMTHIQQALQGREVLAHVVPPSRHLPRGAHERLDDLSPRRPRRNPTVRVRREGNDGLPECRSLPLPT